VVDNTPPPAPEFALKTDSYPTDVDSGDATRSDQISNVGTIKASLDPSVVRWEYIIDGGTTYTRGTGLSFELAEGAYDSGQVLVRGYDRVGNVSVAAQNTASIVIDKQVDTPDAATLVSDTGFDGLDGVTSDPTLQLGDLDDSDRSGEAIFRRDIYIDGVKATGYNGTSTFTPTGLADGQHRVTVVDTDAAGNTARSNEFTFTLNSDKQSMYSIMANSGGLIEGNPGDGVPSFASFTVVRTAEPGVDVSSLPADDITWTVDVSGTSGVVNEADVTAVSGSLHFEAGQGSATFFVPIRRDFLQEGDETLSVSISNPGQGVVDADHDEASTLVVNDDPSLFFSASDVRVTEGDTARFTLARSGGFDSDLDVEYELLVATGDGTRLQSVRTGSSHFSGTSRDSSQIIEVDTLQDGLINGDDRFVVRIKSVTTGDASSITVSGSTASGTIVNDDSLVSIDRIESLSDLDAASPGLAHFRVYFAREGGLTESPAISFSVAGSGENPAKDADFHLPGGLSVSFKKLVTTVTDPATETADPDEAALAHVDFSAERGLISQGVRGFKVSITEESDDTVDHIVLGVTEARANINPDGVDAIVVPVQARLIEGNGTDEHAQSFEIRLSDYPSGPVTVHWQVVPFSTAPDLAAVTASPNDFKGGTYPSGNVTFSSGDLARTITVTPQPLAVMTIASTPAAPAQAGSTYGHQASISARMSSRPSSWALR
jgi:hypothetical protein